MNRRLELHDKLRDLVGNNNVYFQPPASVQISYPCVVYHIGSGDAKRPDPILYNYTNSSDGLFIFKKPTIEIIEQVLNAIPMCRFTRGYVADNLNHYAFTLYY